MLVALFTGLSAGCIVLPAKVKVAQSGNVPTPSGGIALSVLFSRDFSPETRRSLGEEMVECVTRGLAEAAPEVRLVPEEEFHRAVFGVKPGEVLLRADTIRTLLARPDIRQRVGESGLTHVILVGGATHHHSGEFHFKGVGGPGGGIGGGWSSATRSTQLTASIFELASGQVGHVQASAEGRQAEHIKSGLKYLPAVARRLHHCRDLGEPFDFLTWFEYAPGDSAAFEELVATLRRAEEWKYVEREVDIRLVRDVSAQHAAGADPGSPAGSGAAGGMRR